jgi:hypothetical protein
MTQRDTIYVNADGTINHEESGWIIRLTTLVKAGAFEKVGKLHYKLLDETLVKKEFVEIIHLNDHTTTARRTVKSIITGEILDVPTEIESLLELRDQLNKRLKKLRKA